MSVQSPAFHIQFSALWQRRRALARTVEAALDRLFYEADNEDARQAYLARDDELAAVSGELAALLKQHSAESGGEAGPRIQPHDQRRAA